MTATITLNQEMTITHKEFMRLLPAAIAHQPYEKTGQTICISNNQQQVEIHLSDEQIRKLGWLQLSVVQVTLTFTGYSQADVDTFMQRFHLYFQRGGG